MSYTAEEQEQLKRLGFGGLCEAVEELPEIVPYMGLKRVPMQLAHSCGTPVQFRRHNNEKEIIKPVHFCPNCNIEIIGASPDLIWKETNV